MLLHPAGYLAAHRRSDTLLGCLVGGVGRGVGGLLRLAEGDQVDDVSRRQRRGPMSRRCAGGPASPRMRIPMLYC